MQQKIFFICLVLMMTSALQVQAQDALQDSVYKRWFVGTSICLILDIIFN